MGTVSLLLLVLKANIYICDINKNINITAWRLPLWIAELGYSPFIGWKWLQCSHFKVLHIRYKALNDLEPNCNRGQSGNKVQRKADWQFSIWLQTLEWPGTSKTISPISVPYFWHKHTFCPSVLTVYWKGNKITDLISMNHIILKKYKIYSTL